MKYATSDDDGEYVETSNIPKVLFLIFKDKEDQKRVDAATLIYRMNHGNEK